MFGIPKKAGSFSLQDKVKISTSLSQQNGHK